MKNAATWFLEFQGQLSLNQASGFKDKIHNVFMWKNLSNSVKKFSISGLCRVLNFANKNKILITIFWNFSRKYFKKIFGLMNWRDIFDF